MQIKPGTVLAFRGNKQDLSVVIGFDEDYVILYNISTGNIRRRLYTLVRFDFKSL